MEKVKVLFFSADPASVPPHGLHARLQLDAEVREIRQKVRTARYRDDLDLDTHWAMRTDDLLLALNEARPQVVHFSGHGGSGGLMMVGADASRAHSVDAGQLARLFAVFRGDIRLVVLNACSSLPQAEAIAGVVGCAIGTSTEISDTAAILFSASFYRAIAFGCSVGAAFEQARTALDLEHLKERDYLQLVPRPGVDPGELYLVPPRGLDGGGGRMGEGGAGDAAAVPRPARVSRQVRMAAGGLALIGTVGIAATLGELFSTGYESCAWAGEPRALMAAGSSTAGRSGAQSDLDQAKADYEAGRYDSAFLRFRRLANNRNPEAMGFVGLMFRGGQGTTADPDSGNYWIRQAAERDDARAMTELGSAYLDGDAVKRNRGTARHWLQKAADEKQWAEAMRRLGALHRDEQNYGTAIAKYRDAVLAGSLEARIDAGRLYEQGQGVPRDLEMASCLYRTAADAGSIRGMLLMGEIYRYGIGVPLDSARAAEWYRKAAERGSPEGKRALGELYPDGLGVPRDAARRSDGS